jgi:predicted GIY-YIG superfamily endonuclease
VVYLIHFEQPYQHARHYLGFVDGGEAELERRLECHRRGSGARLMAVITQAGIDWVLARTWPDATRTQERRFKKNGASTRLCPICRAQKDAGGGNQER